MILYTECINLTLPFNTITLALACSNQTHKLGLAKKFTPVFLPGESHGQRSLGATVHRVSKSQTGLSD